jgi:hypothetical protein
MRQHRRNLRQRERFSRRFSLARYPLLLGNIAHDPDGVPCAARWFANVAAQYADGTITGNPADQRFLLTQEAVRPNLSNRRRKRSRHATPVPTGPFRQQFQQAPRFRVYDLQRALARSPLIHRTAGSPLRFRIGLLQFPMQACNFCLQLCVGLFQRTGRLRERQKRSRQIFLRCHLALAGNRRCARSLPGAG